MTDPEEFRDWFEERCRTRGMQVHRKWVDMGGKIVQFGDYRAKSVRALWWLLVDVVSMMNEEA